MKGRNERGDNYFSNLIYKKTPLACSGVFINFKLCYLIIPRERLAALNCVSRGIIFFLPQAKVINGILPPL